MNNSSIVVVRSTTKAFDRTKKERIIGAAIAAAFFAIGLFLISLNVWQYGEEVADYKKTVAARERERMFYDLDIEKLEKERDSLKTVLNKEEAEGLTLKSLTIRNRLDKIESKLLEKRTFIKDSYYVGEKFITDLEPVFFSNLLFYLGIFSILVAVAMHIILKNFYKEKVISASTDRIEINIETGKVYYYFRNETERKFYENEEIYSGISRTSLSQNHFDRENNTGKLTITFLKKIEDDTEDFPLTLEFCDNPDQAIKDLNPFFINPEKLTDKKV